MMYISFGEKIQVDNIFFLHASTPVVWWGQCYNWWRKKREGKIICLHSTLNHLSHFLSLYQTNGPIPILLKHDLCVGMGDGDTKQKHRGITKKVDNRILKSVYFSHFKK